MTNKVRIEGSWPSRVTIRRGWARAYARPWNDDEGEGFLRLDRGGADFLRDSAETLDSFGVSNVYSPALYPGSTRMWVRAGFAESGRLGVMERSLSGSVEQSRNVAEEVPNWPEIESLDKAAFEGFWRMSVTGLKEALEATSKSAVLAHRPEGSRATGYAVVGSQWGVSYLQRIGVHPESRGQGVGSDLVRGAIEWARRTASNVMVLNVRDENAAARGLYARHGFSPTGTYLRILRRAL